MKLTIADLDAERDQYEPFVVDLGDREVTLDPPTELPASVLLAVASAGSDLERAVAMSSAPGWSELFADPRVRGGSFTRIVTAYYEHFKAGLGDPGKALSSQS